MKKTVSFLLCLLMVLTSVPVFAGSLNNTGYVQDSNGIKYNVFVPEISMSGSIYDVYPYKNSDNSGLSLAGYTKGASKEINLGYFDIAKWIVSLSDDAEPDYNSGQPYLKSDERLKAVASLLSAINKAGDAKYNFGIRITPYTPQNKTKAKYVVIEMECTGLNVKSHAGQTIKYTNAINACGSFVTSITYAAERSTDPYLFYLFFGSDGQLYAYPKKYSGDDLTISYVGTFGKVLEIQELDYDSTLTMPGSLQRKIKEKINEASFSQTVNNVQWKNKTESMVAGGQYQFSVTGNGNSPVYWSSSDTSVARVSSNGLVSAVKNGSTTITATCNGLSISVSLLVLPQIEWGYAPSNMATGDATTFTVDMKLNSISSVAVSVPVSWKSSNTSVATVNSSGKVTAVSAGTTTITAKVFNQTLTRTVKVARRTITWNSSSAELYIGTAYTFSASASPYAAVTWRSSNTRVATVSSNGVVTPVSAGNAYIYAEAKGASSISRYITVKKPYLKISSYVTSMNVGQSVKFSVNGGPSKTPVWSSSNTRIATVSADGTVKAISSGTVTITAKGNGTSASVTVKVSPPSLTITSSQSSLAIGSSVKFKASASPSATIQWSSSNNSVVTVAADGTVKAHRAGTATIYAKANGLSRSITVTVYKPMSISAWSVPASVRRGSSISPNGIITSGSTIKTVKVEICSLSGSVIARRTVWPYSTSYNLNNMGLLSCGKNPGRFYYKVTATDSRGATILVNKMFTVY